MRLLLLLLWTIAAATLQSTGVQADIIHGIGLAYMSIRTNGVRVTFGDAANAMNTAFLIAAEHFNERLSTYVEYLGSDEMRNCQHNISIDHLYDTMGSSPMALNAYLHHQSNIGPLNFIVGPGTTTESSVMAAVAGVQGVPIVGTHATTPELANKELYPTYTRVNPSSVSLAIAQAEFFKYNNYTDVALIFSNNGFGTSFKDALFKECGARGILLHFIGFDTNDEESMRQAVKALASFKLNVISAGFFPLYYVSIAKYADEFGMSGEDKQWIFQYTGDADIATNSANNPSYRKLLLGSITINPTIYDDGGTENKAFQKFKGNWTTFEKYRTKINSLNPSINGYEKFDIQLRPNFFAETVNKLLPYAGYLYDSVMTIGIAMCKANATGIAPSDVVFKEITKLNYVGLSGTVKFTSTGDRDPSTVTFIITNARPSSNALDGPLNYFRCGTWEQGCGWKLSNDIRFSSGTNQPPAAITISPENLNLIPIEAKRFGYALVAITWISCLVCFVWLFISRNENFVKNSQPEFLALLIIGVTLSNASILALMIDEGQMNAMSTDVACMMFPWCFTIGFMLGFFALFAKTYRILLLFNNVNLRKRVVGARPVLISIAFVLIAESVILIAWTINAPLVWVRTITHRDIYNFPTESTAACVGSNPNTNVFLGLIVAIHCIALMFGAYVATAAREIPQEYQESKWIAMAMSSTLQIFLIGIPTIVATYTTSPTSRFVSMTLIVFVTNIAMLGFIYVPKMLRGWEIFQESRYSLQGDNAYQNDKQNSSDRPQSRTAAVASGTLR